MTGSCARRAVLRPPLQREYPAAGVAGIVLDEKQRRHAGALMRVNHSGEISAQALYVGQALFARNSATQERLARAAGEETDHLYWCERRLHDLESRPSVLNPVWFGGALAIGTLASLCGDRWSLGFVEETEKQVVRHLQSHLEALPYADAPSRAVVSAMCDDEARHAADAAADGARRLPQWVRGLMTVQARVMTRLAYWV